jgi:hypothetical protein
MSTGRLGAVDLAAAVETALYAPAGGERTAIKVVFANRNTSLSARVRVVLRPGAGPTVAADYLAFDEVIPVSESRVSAVFDVENPQEVLVESDVPGVSAQANGLERAIV